MPPQGFASTAGLDTRLALILADHIGDLDVPAPAIAIAQSVKAPAK